MGILSQAILSYYNGLCLICDAWSTGLIGYIEGGLAGVP